jgi:hypothetical protein
VHVQVRRAAALLLSVPITLALMVLCAVGVVAELIAGSAEACMHSIMRANRRLAAWSRSAG